MIKRAYLEITNVCNRACAFCPGCKREKRFLSPLEFARLASKLRPHTDYLYLHVMGEPLFHPLLAEILKEGREQGFKLTITTNGTLLKDRLALLLFEKPYKVNISLHSFEANGKREEGYFENCFEGAKCLAEGGTIIVLRLWNADGDLPGINSENEQILALLKEYFPGEWKKNSKGYTLADHLYLEFDRRFLWPSKDGQEIRKKGRCHGLIDQIAVLCDGTVVPCCLDGEGELALGNLFESDLDTILESPRAKRMKEGFLCAGILHEHLCRTCGYACRFDKGSRFDKG
ncbi:MAG: radical SAM protein [Clostridia bacterium]|nr:radical SAM protein [Clostridia bacterium]